MVKKMLDLSPNWPSLPLKSYSFPNLSSTYSLSLMVHLCWQVWWFKATLADVWPTCLKTSRLLFPAPIHPMMFYFSFFPFSWPLLSGSECVCVCVHWAQGLPSRPGHSPPTVSDSSGVTQLLWDCRSGRINPLWEGTTVPLPLSPASHWPVRTRSTLQSHTLFTKGFASIHFYNHQFCLIAFNSHLLPASCCASHEKVSICLAYFDRLLLFYCYGIRESIKAFVWNVLKDIFWCNTHHKRPSAWQAHAKIPFQKFQQVPSSD